MKFIIAIFALIGISACTPHTDEVAGKFQIPAELKDCSFHNMWNDSGNYITVVRCPNSSTTTKTAGKGPKTVIVVDGVEYEKVKE